ncbi:glycosyltransferase family 4 protein [Sulfitobacter sp. W074]|uniref:glycosyltransferase family 4 protein n=1 Tax=Sulfitobacter sp. W074 TaxID=2867026 RepID=UPI0021A9089A|nr:glycosyltransferase family 4 protein [Sulfitobacter sp. W074]UWR39646.1 glycosyltransferase family 4 protein [Sulfitobacter sp. W074]
MITIVTNMYPSDARPGYGVFVANIEHELRKHGAVEVLFLSHEGGKIRRYFKFYSKIIITLLKRPSGTFYLHNVSHTGLPFVLLSPLLRHRVISHVHGGELLLEHVSSKLYRGALSLIVRKALRRSSVIVSPSAFLQDRLVDHGFQRGAIWISPSGGVEDQFFNSVMLPSRSYYFACGRAEAGKGMDEVVELARKLPHVNFVIATEGTGACTLSGVAKSVENLTVHVGCSRSRLADLYAGAKALIFPTKLNESLGLVALEAMAAGTPVIGPRLGAIPEYLLPGFNGYLVGENSWRGYLKAILQFEVLDDDKWQMLSENARKTALNYRSSTVMEKLAELVFDE